MTLAILALFTAATAAQAAGPYYRRAVPATLAATDDKQWEFELRPGFAVPLGPLADIGKHSATIHLSVERKLNDSLSVGLEVGDNLGHRYEGNYARVGHFTSNVQTSIFQISPLFRLGKDISLAYHSLRPYFVAGCGLYIENRNAGTVTLLPSGVQNKVEAARARGNFGLNGGVGLTFRPSVRVRLGAETRYHYYSQDSDLDGDGYTRDSVRYLTTAVVISWLF